MKMLIAKHQNRVVTNHKCQNPPIYNSLASKYPDASIVKIVNIRYGISSLFAFFIKKDVLPPGNGLRYKYPAINRKKGTAMPTK